MNSTGFLKAKLEYYAKYEHQMWYIFEWYESVLNNKMFPLHTDKRNLIHCTLHNLKKLKCFSSRLAVVIVQSIEAKYLIQNEDVVGRTILLQIYSS